MLRTRQTAAEAAEAEIEVLQQENERLRKLVRFNSCILHFIAIPLLCHTN